MAIINVIEPVYKRVQGIHRGLADIPGAAVILQERFADFI